MFDIDFTSDKCIEKYREYLIERIAGYIGEDPYECTALEVVFKSKSLSKRKFKLRFENDIFFNIHRIVIRPVTKDKDFNIYVFCLKDYDNVDNSLTLTYKISKETYYQYHWFNDIDDYFDKWRFLNTVYSLSDDSAFIRFIYNLSKIINPFINIQITDFIGHINKIKRRIQKSLYNNKIIDDDLYITNYSIFDINPKPYATNNTHSSQSYIFNLSDSISKKRIVAYSGGTRVCKQYLQQIGNKYHYNIKPDIGINICQVNGNESREDYYIAIAFKFLRNNCVKERFHLHWLFRYKYNITTNKAELDTFEAFKYCSNSQIQRASYDIEFDNNDTLITLSLISNIICTIMNFNITESQNIQQAIIEKHKTYGDVDMSF